MVENKGDKSNKRNQMGKMDRQYHATQSQASLNPGEDGNAVCLCVFLFVVSIFHKHSSGAE